MAKGRGQGRPSGGRTPAGQPIGRPAGQRPAQEAAGSEAGVSVDSLKQPPLAGYADKCDIKVGATTTEFLFYHGDRPDNTVVVARIVVSHDDLLLHFWNFSKNFLDQVGAALESYGLEPGGLTYGEQVPTDVGPILANVFRLTRVGVDGQLDCYYVTARSAWEMSKRNGSLRFLGLYSIQMSLPLMVALLRHVESRTDELTAFTAKLHPGLVK